MIFELNLQRKQNTGKKGTFENWAVRQYWKECFKDKSTKTSD